MPLRFTPAGRPGARPTKALAGSHRGQREFAAYSIRPYLLPPSLVDRPNRRTSWDEPRRIHQTHRAAAILAGQCKSGDPADPASATAYATHLADNLPGLFRAGIHKIGRFDAAARRRIVDYEFFRHVVLLDRGLSKRMKCSGA